MGIILSAITTQFISDLILPNGTTFLSGTTTELISPDGNFTLEEVRSSVDLQTFVNSGDIVLTADGDVIQNVSTAGINYISTYGGIINSDVEIVGSLSADTIYSGSTPIEQVIINIAEQSSDVTRVQPGLNMTTGGTPNLPVVNLETDITLNSVNATSVSGGTISGDTIYSGGTDLYNIFLTTADGNDITRVQPGPNITTGGTGNIPVVSVVDSPSFNNIAISGTGTAGAFSASTLSGDTIYSAGTDLYNIFLTTADGNDITRVQPGTNMNTGGTVNFPIVNLNDDIIINSMTANTKAFVKVLEISGQTMTAGTVQMLYATDANPNAFCIRRTDAGGYMCYMDNANFPQIMMGNSTDAVSGFLDVENSASLFLNVLHNGKVQANPLLPNINQNTWLGESGDSWGQFYSDGFRVDRYPDQISGTIAMTAGDTVVNGSGTTFLSDLSPGDTVMVWRKSFGNQAEEHQFLTVSAITSNTSMTFTTPFAGTSPFDDFNIGEIYTNSGNLIEITDINDNVITSISQDGTLTGTSIGAVFLSGDTIYSGSTNLESVILSLLNTTEDTTRVQGGINTFTGGTGNLPTVNITGASLDNLFVSGANISNSLSASTISGDTIFSGSTDLSALFDEATKVSFGTTAPPTNKLWYNTSNSTLFGFDSTRSKWISTGDPLTFAASRNNANVTDQYLRHYNGTPYNLVPAPLPFDATLTQVVLRGQDPQTWRGFITTGTSLPADIIINLSSGGGSYVNDATYNIDLNEGDDIYFYCSGTSIDYPRLDLYFKRRS